MTDLEYIQMRLGEGASVDLERDMARANEERSIAVRSLFGGCTRRLRDFLHSFMGISSRPLTSR